MGVTDKIVKAGAAAGALYVAYKYVDEKHNISSDVSLARRLLSLRGEMTSRFESGDYNVTSMWYETLKKNPKKTCFYYEDDQVSFEQVEKRSNQVAQWLLSKGLKKGDTVALLMENRPEFVISWLGITKIGVKVALINTSIKQQSLLHCVKISECKMLLFGSELADSVRDIKDEIENLGIFLCSEGQRLDFALDSTEEIAIAPSSKIPIGQRKGIGMGDVFGYIYTSGTTGLPKAAIILHQKMFAFGALMARGFLISENDIVYTCLPLFHSAGGGLGIGLMLYTGCSVVIKRKFSAREFWNDCVRYKCTVVQYIGELCRYLLNPEPVAAEKQHRVRIAIGNGLRPEIWGEFQDRFNIPEIGEFYGSTEGNAALINHCTSPETRGAVGRYGTLMMKITGVRLVKFDVVEEEPIRGPDGFCIDCADGEPGELLMVIKDDDPTTRFAGYNNKKATQKKIIENVFLKGDKYFRTGDLLSRDSKGLFRFVDRIGDTFRWKGENCSTTEVTQVLATFPGVEEINVYGVQIPNNMDGRAPTAGITPVDGDISNIDLKGLADYARANLPSYAVPLFIRVLPQMAVTATMKHQKVKLRKEGIDISVVDDPIYWLSPETKTYEPFTEEAFKKVTSIKAKL